jgi:perosamine synthetase
MSNSIKKLAILGGKPILSSELPQYNTIGKEEIKAAEVVLKSGVLSGFVATSGPHHLGGKHVLALESAFCDFFGAKFAVSMNSATSCIHAALVAAGIECDDEVIVPPYSMSASATAVIMAGGRPVFVDIEADNFCIQPELVERAISPRTRAIVAVNLFGQPADLLKLRSIADQNGLILIEDNAQAPAAKFETAWTGSVGHMGVFSLNRHKTIQCGEGGVVICEDERFASRLRMVRNHGEAVFPELGENEREEAEKGIVGFNYRLTELQAAIALPQLHRLQSLNKVRVELANRLTEELTSFDFLKPPNIRDKCTHVYYLYPIKFEAKKLGISRSLFMKALSAEGLPISNYARPLYQLPLFGQRGVAPKFLDPYNYPVTENLWKNSMMITSICRPPFDEQIVIDFIKAINKICSDLSELKKIEDLH